MEPQGRSSTVISVGESDSSPKTPLNDELRYTLRFIQIQLYLLDMWRLYHLGDLIHII